MKIKFQWSAEEIQEFFQAEISKLTMVPKEQISVNDFEMFSSGITINVEILPKTKLEDIKEVENGTNTT